MTTLTYRNDGDEVVVFGGKMLRLQVHVNGVEAFNGRCRMLRPVHVEFTGNEKGAKTHKFTLRHQGAYGFYVKWQRGDEVLVDFQ